MFTQQAVQPIKITLYSLEPIVLKVDMLLCVHALEVYIYLNISCFSLHGSHHFKPASSI